jgi:phosphatidylglycerophosphatase A
MIHVTSLSRAVCQKASFFIAFGLGAGLLPRAPGTFGTLLAIPLFSLFSENTFLMQLFIVIGLFVVGVYTAETVTKELGQEDYKGIVIDEIVGFFVTMMGLPLTIPTALLGFMLFRWLDIQKPFPIAWIEKQVQGGLGVMLDDVVAGLLAAFFLHIILYFLP